MAETGATTTEWRVLAVDDEPTVLDLIESVLGAENLTVETAADGFAAWEKITAPDSDFSFMILDHQLPGMNGLELLRRIKADDKLKMMPVIMQSGAATPEEIAAGIEAGAFYYLTKPWTATAMCCIVRAVLAELNLRLKSATQAAGGLDLKNLLSAEVSFATLEDVHSLSGTFSSICPAPYQAGNGLVELLLNAVEHGNLELSYEDKKDLMWEDRWEAEVRRRLELPEYRGRRATLKFRRSDEALEFRITDQGPGFDWRRYLEFDPERSGDPNGRGIAIARRFSFSRIEYLDKGNVVVATIDLQG